ncbi:MAG: glycosyltransferase family 9 protein [Rhodanobacteraceae bacterium]
MHGTLAPVLGTNWSALALVPKLIGRRRSFVSRLLAGQQRRVDAQLCRPGQLPAHGIYRVLVCRPNHRLGNTLLLSPLLRELETLYPGAEIDIISAGEAAVALYSSRFQVRKIASFYRHAAKHLLHTIRQLRAMRAHTYDLAIDASMDSNSGRLLLGLARARYKLGFAHDAAPDKALAALASNCPEHHGKRIVHLLRTAYAGDCASSWPTLNLDLSIEEMRKGAKALQRITGELSMSKDSRPVIGIFANATGKKCYPESWWTAFVTQLRVRRPDLRIVNVLAQHGNSQLPQVPAGYFTSNLRHLGAVLANLDGFISADCGVMHLAVATGIPTLGLFTADNIDKYAPFGGNNAALKTQSSGLDPVFFEQAAGWLDKVLPVHSDAERVVNHA